MCRITISRFWRDRGIFDALVDDVLPALARNTVDRGGGTIRCWSCGCASGEEPYSVAIGWRLRVADQYPGIELEVIATDGDLRMLDRARRGAYGGGSLRDLPPEVRRATFHSAVGGYRLAGRFRHGVTWLCHDVRSEPPAGPFDMVLCRNLVFTYFDEMLQIEIARRLAKVLRPGGALVIGSHEFVPTDTPAFKPWGNHRSILRRMLENAGDQGFGMSSRHLMART